MVDLQAGGNDPLAIQPVNGDEANKPKSEILLDPHALPGYEEAVEEGEKPPRYIDVV